MSERGAERETAEQFAHRIMICLTLDTGEPWSEQSWDHANLAAAIRLRDKDVVSDALEALADREDDLARQRHEQAAGGAWEPEERLRLWQAAEEYKRSAMRLRARAAAARGQQEPPA